MASFRWAHRILEKTHERVDFLVPALGVSIIIAIFAVVTQCLNATSAAWLSTTQMVTVWLASIALIVLLWIAYMTSRAYVTAHPEKNEAEQPRTTPDVIESRYPVLTTKNSEQRDRPDEYVVRTQTRDEVRNAGRPSDATRAASSGQPEDESEAEDEHAWIPPSKLRYLDGRAHPVNTEDVFPDRCCLVPGQIRVAPDKLNGELAAKCKVVDPNPSLNLNDRAHDTVVNIIPPDHMPDTRTWPRYAVVEFENLSVVPYETDRGQLRMGYALRATGVHLAREIDLADQAA